MDHLARPREPFSREVRQREDLGRRAYRRQWIAQLVRQRGEELVFALVGLAQHFLAVAQPGFGETPIRDVELCAHGANGTAFRAFAGEQRSRSADDPAHLAVAAPDAVLHAEVTIAGW